MQDPRIAKCRKVSYGVTLNLTLPWCSYAAVAFADPAKYAGKQVPVVSEYLSWPQAAEILTEVTGIPVKCAPRPCLPC